MKAWPRFLPDLTLWHSWHAERGTLPDPWRGLDLPGVCAALGVEAWMPAQRWRVELPGIEVSGERGTTERLLSWRTPRGTLRSRWILGPDGDWWQAEYPVKSSADLAAALLVAQARRYVPEPVERAPAPHSPSGILRPLELPQRPWSELFHSFLGWSEGLMIFMEEPEPLRAIAAALEEKLAGLEEALADGPEEAVLCPDNLDAQFMTPEAFEESMAQSYARTAALFHGRGKPLVVHAGGPVLRLLPALAAIGVDCVEGVCGPPQGDSPLPAARAAGGSLGLWGGIAQDFLLSTRTEEELVSAAREAFAHAASDPGCIVGIADKVPADALPERLVALAGMAAVTR